MRPFNEVIIFMNIFDADILLICAGGASIGYGYAPGHREDALIFDRQIELEGCGQLLMFG
jgi:hypothetical protein